MVFLGLAHLQERKKARVGFKKTKIMSILNTLSLKLSSFLSNKYQIEENELELLTKIGENSLKSTLKNHVLKHGTDELENILLEKTVANKTKIHQVAIENLTLEINQLKTIKNLDENFAQSAIDFVLYYLIQSFKTSNLPKNLNGICDFLDIDKSLVKAINSPFGKMFGKFMK